MELILAYDRKEDVRRLFREYEETIVAGDADVQLCLDAQNYKEEADHIEEKYGLPGGRLYLAVEDGRAIGCGALRRNDDVYCELKRLFVEPEYRGRRIGKALFDRILADARAIGYRYIRLDTFVSLERAVAMYRRHGFYDIPKYNDNPAKTMIFLQKDLRAPGEEAPQADVADVAAEEDGPAEDGKEAF